jgi:ligand-binding SRPBCC domain-containing protein
VLLKKFLNTFTVNAGIDKVWEFYTDLHHLDIITPKQLQLRVDHVISQKLAAGQTISLSGRFLTRRSWNTDITFLEPYIYVDEMKNGPFKLWKHIHTFKKINDNETEVVDEIDFELPFGVIGRLFERYAMGQLKRIFDHRQEATKAVLE